MLAAKDPDAVLDVAWRWEGWMPEGDSIASHEIIAEGVDLGASTHDYRHVVTAWISGGVEGTLARVRCEITTAQGASTAARSSCG
jgi:hypothetical protein